MRPSSAPPADSHNRLPAEPPVARGKNQAAYANCTDDPILAEKMRKCAACDAANSLRPMQPLSVSPSPNCGRCDGLWIWRTDVRDFGPLVNGRQKRRNYEVAAQVHRVTSVTTPTGRPQACKVSSHEETKAHSRLGLTSSGLENPTLKDATGLTLPPAQHPDEPPDYQHHRRIRLRDGTTIDRALPEVAGPGEIVQPVHDPVAIVIAVQR